MDARRKIMFYLNPETNIADSIVNETLDSIPQGERGRLNRAALIAGIALYRQDARIPFLISELLNKDTQFADIVQLLKSVYPAHRQIKIKRHQRMLQNNRLKRIQRKQTLKACFLDLPPEAVKATKNNPAHAGP